MDRLVALFALCIAMVECGTFFQPDVILGSKCSKIKFIKCVGTNLEQYEDKFATYAEVASFAENPTNVDDLANSFEAAQTCVENENQEDFCSGDNQDDVVDENVNFVANFLKNPFNRELAVNASESLCLAFPDRITYVKQDFNYYCLGGLWTALEDPDTEDYCEEVDTMKRCMLDVVNYHCGHAAAAFIDYAWSYGVHTPYGKSWIENSDLPASIVNACY